MENIVKTQTSKAEVVFARNISSSFPDEYMSWIVIGFSNELTDEQWTMVVDESIFYAANYRNYMTTNINSHRSSQCNTATDSGKSLMESLEIEGNWLVLIKTK